jgi:hypothetical protein
LLEDTPQIQKVLVERFIISSISKFFTSETLEQKLKAVEIPIDIENGTSLTYEQVCYTDSKTGKCLSLAVGSEETRAEGEIEIVFFLQDTPSAKRYLEKFREMEQISLGLDEIDSILVARINRIDPTEGQSDLSRLSLYPYSTLSIFTRTHYDVFTPIAYPPTTPYPSSASYTINQNPHNPIRTVQAGGNPARHIKFLAYSLRALVTRFWLLAKNADSADIFMVLLGYVLMHFTFVRLFLNMRKMGSSFWLRELQIVRNGNQEIEH